MKHRYSRQQGLTLIELMIAVFLGLIVSASLIQVLISNKMTSRVQTEVSRLQESARFAVESISQDLRSADYWGCNEDIARVTNHVTDTTSSAYFDIEKTISGVDGEDEQTPDSIKLIGAKLINEAKLKPNASFNSPSAVGFSDNNIDTSKFVGKAIIIANCLNSDIFRVNAVVGKTFVHNQSLSGDYDNRAFFYSPYEVEYLIKENTLVRKLKDEEIVIANGVKNMQIYYGEDTSGDGFANHFVSQADIGDFNAVVSVKLHLLLSTPSDNVASQPQSNDFAKLIAYQKVDKMSATTAGNYDDNSIYFPFSFTIAIRNRIL